jgi:hypothetical protein
MVAEFPRDSRVALHTLGFPGKQTSGISPQAILCGPFQDPLATPTMSHPTTWARAFEQACLRPVFRRLKKITGIGRVSAVAARVDRLAALEPRIVHLEVLQSRVEALERRIEEAETLCREQVGLQYLQLAAGAVETRPDALFSQRRAK